MEHPTISLEPLAHNTYMWSTEAATWYPPNGWVDPLQNSLPDMWGNLWLWGMAPFELKTETFQDFEALLKFWSSTQCSSLTSPELPTQADYNATPPCSGKSLASKPAAVTSQEDAQTYKKCMVLSAAESTDTGSDNTTEDLTSCSDTLCDRSDGVKMGMELLALLQPDLPASSIPVEMQMDVPFTSGDLPSLPLPPGLSQGSSLVTPPPGLFDLDMKVMSSDNGLPEACAVENQIYLPFSPSSGCDADVSSDEMQSSEPASSSPGSPVSVQGHVAVPQSFHAIPSVEEADLADSVMQAEPRTEEFRTSKPLCDVNSKHVEMRVGNGKKVQGKVRSKQKPSKQLSPSGSKAYVEPRQLRSKSLPKKQVSDSVNPISFHSVIYMFLLTFGFFTAFMVAAVVLPPLGLVAKGVLVSGMGTSAATPTGISHAAATVSPSAASSYMRQQTVATLAKSMDVEFARGRAVASHMHSKIAMHKWTSKSMRDYSKMTASAQQHAKTIFQQRRYIVLPSREFSQPPDFCSNMHR
jgi:hypothetical protein